MTIGIVGSRDWGDLDRVDRWVMALAAKHPEAIVVSGAARGVDQAAETAALRCGLGLISYQVFGFRSMGGAMLYSIETVTQGEAAQEIVVAKRRRITPPTFPSFGRAAIFRNGWIVEDADRLVAFWNGLSNGTADSIAKAHRCEIPVHVYRELAT
jgi:hypothetical protein